MSPESPTCALVMPCYNEERRLDPESLRRLVDENPSITLLCVNDGSTDGTEQVLLDLARHPRISTLSLDRNAGKAEAVRQGLLQALGIQPDIVGYFDADLATPVDEIARLAGMLASSGRKVVLGARVQLLGHHVERKRSRHYLGRLYATVASIVLRLPIYDTQAGAKFFTDTPQLRDALSEPFQDQWSFDVELIGRLISLGLSAEDVQEVPLKTWADIGESKVKPSAAARSLLSLFTLRRHIRRFSTRG